MLLHDVNSLDNIRTFFAEANELYIKVVPSISNHTVLDEPILSA
jgi:hypothetical protein